MTPKTSIIFTLMGGGGLAVLFLSCFTNIAPFEQGTPYLELRLKEFHQDTQQVLLQLTIKNIGQSPLVLPRLKNEYLTKYLTWGGWHIDIFHNELDERFWLSEGYIGVVYWARDLWRLKPGEQSILNFNIAEARKTITSSGEEKIPRLPLAMIAGNYTIKVRLSLHENAEIVSPFLSTWMGTVESNTVHIEIPKTVN